MRLKNSFKSKGLVKKIEKLDNDLITLSKYPVTFGRVKRASLIAQKATAYQELGELEGNKNYLKAAAELWRSAGDMIEKVPGKTSYGESKLYHSKAENLKEMLDAPDHLGRTSEEIENYNNQSFEKYKRLGLTSFVFCMGLGTLLLSLNMTGNVIGTRDSTISSVIGLLLIVSGLTTAFLLLKKTSKKVVPKKQKVSKRKTTKSKKKKNKK